MSEEPIYEPKEVRRTTRIDVYGRQLPELTARDTYSVSVEAMRHRNPRMSQPRAESAARLIEEFLLKPTT